MNAIKTAAATPKGLMFLEAHSFILEEQLTQIFQQKAERDLFEHAFCDFDDVGYKISNREDALNIVKVQLKMRNVPELKRAGSAHLLEGLFPGLEVQPDADYNYAVQFDVDAVADPVALTHHLSALKRHMFGGPLHQAFHALADDKTDSLNLFKVEYRKGEMFFICPGRSKVVVIFLVDFADRTDKAFARLVLQQMTENKVTNCPVMSYSKEPPGELAGVTFAYNADTAGFISFAFEQLHIRGEGFARLDKAVTLLTGFRNYLHYHIKCSKTYLHIRMRKRVSQWLQVLERARPAAPEEKRTMDGKRYVRDPAAGAGAGAGV